MSSTPKKDLTVDELKVHFKNVVIAFNTSSHNGMIQEIQILPHNAVLGCFLGLVMLCTIFGNSLVIVSVLKERYLQSITNYFIVSLATADLFMGSIVMPFAIVQQFLDNDWPFGEVWCDIWHALDVLCSTASILNLCMIAMERFWATENPITYPTKMTSSRCNAMIAAVWLLSCLISFPAIIWWRHVSIYKENACNFTDDKIYIIISSIVSFYIPLIIMVVVYFRIYQTATNLVRSLNTGARIMYKNGQQGDVMVLRIHRGRRTSVTKNAAVNFNQANHRYTTASSNSCSDSEISGSLPASTPKRYLLGDNLKAADSPAHMLLHRVSEEDIVHQSANHAITKKLRRFAVGKRLSKFAREQKAAKTLGFVMGIFIICWLPFFVCNIVLAIDAQAFGRHKNNLLVVVTWLGYVNSGINPAIYAHSMRDFRRAFLKILCSWWIHRQHRNDAAHRMEVRMIGNVDLVSSASFCHSSCYPLQPSNQYRRIRKQNDTDTEFGCESRSDVGARGDTPSPPPLAHILTDSQTSSITTSSYIPPRLIINNA